MFPHTHVYRSVNVLGVVNFASTVCIYAEQSTFPCSSGPNPSEQKPNQTKTGQSVAT